MDGFTKLNQIKVWIKQKNSYYFFLSNRRIIYYFVNNNYNLVLVHNLKFVSMETSRVNVDVCVEMYAKFCLGKIRVNNFYIIIHIRVFLFWFNFLFTLFSFNFKTRWIFFNRFGCLKSYRCRCRCCFFFSNEEKLKTHRITNTNLNETVKPYKRISNLLLNKLKIFI